MLNFTTDPGDKDYFTLSLGMSLVMIGGGQLFASFDTALGLEAVTSRVVTFGYRREL